MNEVGVRGGSQAFMSGAGSRCGGDAASRWPPASVLIASGASRQQGNIKTSGCRMTHVLWLMGQDSFAAFGTHRCGCHMFKVGICGSKGRATHLVPLSGHGWAFSRIEEQFFLHWPSLLSPIDRKSFFFFSSKVPRHAIHLLNVLTARPSKAAAPWRQCGNTMSLPSLVLHLWRESTVISRSSGTANY
jgi:hypothetical protein